MGSIASDPPTKEIPRSTYDLNTTTYAAENDMVRDIVSGMEIAGGCIVRGLFTPETMSTIMDEMRPYFAKATAADGDFWPDETRVIGGLISKSDTFALEVVGSRVWHKVNDHFLTSYLQRYWHGQEMQTSASKPQLNNTIAFRIGPGARDQVWHRDDIVHHTWNGAADKYELGRDTALTMFVACTRTTEANGATRFIPGSHLWDYARPPPVKNDAGVFCELAPGDAFFMLSSAYHAGSANKTTDEFRCVVGTVATRGYLRQEENQYIAHDPDKIRKLPVWLQKFVGYTISEPFMGFVDLADPLKKFNPAAADFVEAIY